MSDEDIWAALAYDPRRPEHVHLRAADRDRDAVAQVLAEAYADGRLDHDEFDLRSTRLSETRTLGELPALVSDLVAPNQASPVPMPGRLSPEQIRARAVESVEREQRQALWTMISASLICAAIWAYAGLGSGWAFDPSFPWPLFVLFGTGLNYAAHAFDRNDSITKETRRLERKEEKRAAKELEVHRPPAIGYDPPDNPPERSQE